ncbi:MAG: hypothetical protein LC627_02015 [Verrucomicrobiaceae bacterium]|nr:hypothetical protein [Verrucomicrobiaceae bacterium]
MFEHLVVLIIIGATSIFDHPVILLVVIAASILRWLWQKSQAERKASEMPPMPGEPDQPIPRAEAQTEEERIRRFMEALGQPVSSRPPPPVMPRTSVPRQTALPPMRSPLPPLRTAPPPLPPPAPSISRASEPPPFPPRVFQSAPVQEAGFEVRDLDTVSLQNPSRDDPRASVKPQERFLSKLTSREGLRSAIVLREIFGPPRSLQSFDVN